MANAYVSDLWGNDSNDGLTIGQAKATIGAGIDVAGDNDTVFVYPGIYSEQVSEATKPRFFVGVGKVINGGVGTAFNIKNSAVDGFEINNCTYGLEVYGPVAIGPIKNCIIYDCSTAGMYCEDYSVRSINNIIYNCGIGINAISIFEFGVVDHNTIYNCSIGLKIDIDGGTGLFSGKIINTIFSECAVSIHSVDTEEITVNSFIRNGLNNNIYDIPGGGSIAKYDNGSTDVAALSDWQVDTAQESGSLSEDPLFASPTNGIFSVLDGSPAIELSDNGGIIGAQLKEIGWYNKTIAASGSDATNLKLSSSGIGLTPGFSSGNLITSIIDLGEIRHIENIFDAFFYEDFDNDIMIDTDVSDNDSTNGLITIGVRIADTEEALDSMGYTEYNLREVIENTFVGRYIQTRLIFNR